MQTLFWEQLSNFPRENEILSHGSSHIFFLYKKLLAPQNAQNVSLAARPPLTRGLRCVAEAVCRSLKARDEELIITTRPSALSGTDRFPPSTYLTRTHSQSVLMWVRARLVSAPVPGTTNDMVDGSQHWLCALDLRVVRHVRAVTRGG